MEFEKRFGASKEEIIHEIIKKHKELDYSKFREEIEDIAKEFTKVPFICSVFGVGYPFYGDYDVVDRITRTKRKSILKLVPDIDLILVYDSDEYPRDLTSPFWNRVSMDFSSTIGREARRWTRLKKRLLKRKVAIGKNDDEILKNFMNDIIHIDINAVPRDLWEDLPYLFKDEDLEHLSRVGIDVLFTSHPLSFRKHFESHLDVPSKIRMHKLLDETVNNKNRSLNEIIDKLVKSHPHYSLSRRYPQVMKHHRGIWEKAFENLKEEGLVEERDGKISVTKLGLEFHNKLLKKRKDIRKKWRLPG